MRIARLERKNLPQNKEATFDENDSISIRLTSAYIRDYTEGPFSWANDAIEGQFRSRGEIAIVVNAFAVNKTVAFNFSDKAVDKGKVVFFSDDVVAGQFMNFNNMPIYGPSSEGKNGIGLEIWIMELDISDVLTGKLLRDIASYGTIPLPFSAIGNKLLESMGKSLLSSDNTHDTNFSYRVLLEPKKGTMLPNAPLEVGHYVFIQMRHDLIKTVNNIANLDFNKVRTGGRDDDIDWSELVLDENSGRLYKKVKKNGGQGKCDKCDNSCDFIEYTDRNYLIISIDKDTSGRDLSVENKLYEAFVGATKGSADSNQFVETIVMDLEMRKIMKLFDRYFEAVSKAKHAQQEAEKDGKEDDAEKKAAAAWSHAAYKRTYLINRFKSFWNAYIKSPLEKYHDGKSVEKNSFDLGEDEIGQISGQFMAKLSQGVSRGIIKNIASCTDDLFTWLPNGTGAKQTGTCKQSSGQKVDEIKKGIVSIIRDSKCPCTSQ